MSLMFTYRAKYIHFLFILAFIIEIVQIYFTDIFNVLLEESYNNSEYLNTFTLRSNFFSNMINMLLLW